MPTALPSSSFAHHSFTVSELDHIEAETPTFQANEISSFNRTVSQRDITPSIRISASSSKSGHPAENLRVTNIDDVNKLWQSDGSTPHHITLEIPKQIQLSVILNIHSQSYS